MYSPHENIRRYELQHVHCESYSSLIRVSKILFKGESQKHNHFYNRLAKALISVSWIFMNWIINITYDALSLIEKKKKCLRNYWLWTFKLKLGSYMIISAYFVAFMFHSVSQEHVLSISSLGCCSLWRKYLTSFK